MPARYECQWCEEELRYGSPDVYIIHTSSNHQSFAFCTKTCARDWLVELTK